MKKLQFIILLMGLITLYTASARLDMVTWGHADTGMGLIIGDNWYIGVSGSTAPCTSSWNCSLYSACNYTNTKYCVTFTDIYSCGGNFTENVSDYDEDCSFCDDNPDIDICEAHRMDLVAISIAMIGGMFFLVYMANSLKSQKEDGSMVPLTFMLKMILYSTAAFMFFISILYAYSISVAQSLSATIESGLQTLYMFVIWIGVIVMFLILFGVGINYGIKSYRWLYKYFNRKNGKI